MNKSKKKLSLPLRILIILIVLVAVFLCAVILSGESAPSVGNSDTSNSSSDKERVLIDDDAVKVSFVGAEDASSLGVFYVTLKIENKTDTAIAINLANADVDGETIPLITTGVPLVIRPGNSGQTGFIFSMANLSISTMDEAEKATFQVVARDNDTYDVVYESELVTVDLQ